MAQRVIRKKKKGSRRLIKRKRRITRKQRGGSSNKTIDLVISRYKEPVSWLGLYKNKGFHRIIIYNKSDTPYECPAIENKHTKCEVKNATPNVGVCDHTYLHHIVENYDNLADLTVFAPGSAEMDHKAQLLEMTMKKVFETKNTVFNVYDFKMSVGEAMYNFTMPTYPTGHLDNRDNLGGESPQALANIRPFGAWYAANFPGEQATKATFFGIMAISRAHIHKKPVSFYKGLIEQVNKEKFHEASHFMERAWNASMHPIPDSCYYESEIMNFKIGHDQGGYKVMRRQGGGNTSTFHVVIVTAGRPALSAMIDSLKGQLNEADALTIIFDGKMAKTNAGYSEDWVNGMKCKVTVLEEIPGLKNYGHLTLNKHLPGLQPQTTYVMYADDDDVYTGGAFDYLRKTCVDPNTMYIAQMKTQTGSVIPPNGKRDIELGKISKQCGIVPFSKRTESKFGIKRTGDFDYYRDIQDKIPNIVYLEHIIYEWKDTANAYNGNIKYREIPKLSAPP